MKDSIALAYNNDDDNITPIKCLFLSNFIIKATLL